MSTRGVLPVVILGLAAGCLEKSRHPSDVEDPAIPDVTTGICDGVLVGGTDLFDGPGVLGPARPPAGAEVVVEGRPLPAYLCTGGGCVWECCESRCEALADCPVALEDGERNRICLVSDRFGCSGTDCSMECHPFSTHPKGTYRFKGRIRYDEQGSAFKMFLDVEAFCALAGSGRK